MKREKQTEDKLSGGPREPDERGASGTSKISSKTMMIGVTLVGALGLGYFVYNKFKSSLHLPALTTAIIEQRETFEQETRRREEVPRGEIITPSKAPKLTGVVNME